MTEKEWLMRLRKCQKMETLEKVIEKKSQELNGAALIRFWGAADHRLAELISGRLYTKVPASVWRMVR